MATVPNWIGKAVVLRPSQGRDQVTPTVHWRATRTQVIVQTSPNGPELRFYLDTLTMIGQSKYSTQSIRLVAPDDPRVVAARNEQIVSDARNAVLTEIEKQRLQDSNVDADALAVKLMTIRDAVHKALAGLVQVL